MSIKVYIDQGHNPSGFNAGAEGNGYREQDITYDIGYRLYDYLAGNPAFEPRLSRNTPDEVLGTSNSSSLSARVREANSWGADLFLSLHTNAAENPNATGSEALVYRSGSTAYRLAELILEELAEITGLRNRGVLIRPGIYVIARTNMPAVLVELGFIKIYLEGIINALLIIIRIVLLIMASTVFLTYTTTPLALTDALERLLSPLKKLRVPVHEFSMMMTIALRFIPTLIDETKKIINAQTARGADFSSGSLISRAKALIPILIPLFVSSFRRADELATAMECRCYTGGEGRTRMNVLRTKPRDYVFLAAVVLLGAGIILVNRYLPIYSLSL